jgi:hypothetical protein
MNSTCDLIRERPLMTGSETVIQRRQDQSVTSSMLCTQWEGETGNEECIDFDLLEKLLIPTAQVTYTHTSMLLNAASTLWRAAYVL